VRASTSIGSAEAEVEIADSASPALELATAERVILTGRVVSPRGPVIGARLIAYPVFARLQRHPALRTVSDADGAFSLALPPDVLALRLVVLPPGHAARVLRVATRTAGPLVVPVDEIGGTISLRGVVPGGRREAARLVADGISVDVAALDDWPGLRTDGSWDGAWTLPAMSVGEYALCATENGPCDEGFLEPHKTLVLTLPPREEGLSIADGMDPREAAP
jgi:hypothetical protein